MLKIRIGRKRGERRQREADVLAEQRRTLAPGYTEPAASESHVGYNKAGRAYDTRTGRLIKSADLTSHEI